MTQLPTKLEAMGIEAGLSTYGFRVDSGKYFFAVYDFKDKKIPPYVFSRLESYLPSKTVEIENDFADHVLHFLVAYYKGEGNVQ